MEGLAKAKADKDPVCFYPKAHRLMHSHRWSGTKKDIFYSMWKLNAVCAAIRGKSLIDAKNLLDVIDKKGGEFVRELLQELENAGVRRGRAPEQMWVRTITCGSGVVYKAPDIKGRGRCGTIRKPKCSMRIVLEERTAEDYFKMVLKGETPSGMSSMYR